MARELDERYDSPRHGGGHENDRGKSKLLHSRIFTKAVAAQLAPHFSTVAYRLIIFGGLCMCLGTYFSIILVVVHLHLLLCILFRYILADSFLLGFFRVSLVLL